MQRMCLLKLRLRTKREARMSYDTTNSYYPCVLSTNKHNITDCLPDIKPFGNLSNFDEVHNNWELYLSTPQPSTLNYNASLTQPHTTYSYRSSYVTPSYPLSFWYKLTQLIPILSCLLDSECWEARLLPFIIMTAMPLHMHIYLYIIIYMYTIIISCIYE